MSWAYLERAGGAAIDAVLEESFTIQRAAPAPAGDVNARRARAGDPVPFKAVWAEPDVQRFPDARGHPGSDAREFGDGLPRIDYPSAALPFRPDQACIVVRLATGIRYAVSHVGGNGFTRTVLTLTAKGLPA